VTEIRNFLGLARFYRKFIEGFLTIASPMTRLTQKGVRFVWTRDCENSFQELKEKVDISSSLNSSRRSRRIRNL
jgi:hypothetical protein